MNIPGFTASASAYKTSGRYFMTSMTSQIGGVTLAGTCTCTDPNCTWTCPIPDPCARCGSLPTPCARARCFCLCEGGIPVSCRPGPSCPCGFLCT